MSINFSLLAAIVLLLVFPSAATILFLRSSRFAKHQLMHRLLLASAIYIGVVITGVIAGIIILLQFPSHELKQAEYAVKIDSWKSHPKIKEIRAEVKDIKTGIKQYKIKIRARRFNIESPMCSTYPISFKSLATDKENRPRLLKIEQIISHGDLLIIERYYDKNGKLRFVFEDHGANTNTRIYLNASGAVIWSVEQSGDEFMKGNTLAGEYETKPAIASLARENFLYDQLCPEKMKGK